MFSEIQKYFPDDFEKLNNWEKNSKEERLLLLKFFNERAFANEHCNAPAPSSHAPSPSNRTQTISIKNNVSIQISTEHKLILKKLGEEYEQHKDDSKKLTEILTEYAPVVMKIIAALPI
ncbi:hypothetical protein IPN35_01850 [Candidatus Peregrinibacteria bacterium]|nr:MAG: hypothetical protein IPN35_01850 [Candidatus Peregrinibacteria bacterium]